MVERLLVTYINKKPAYIFIGIEFTTHVSPHKAQSDKYYRIHAFWLSSSIAVAQLQNGC
jgi:hypothetical protein